MMRIVKLHESLVESIVREVVQALEQGKTIVCPTDTVYGVLADATNQEAVDKVFRIKQRAKDKPIYVFIRDMEMARQYAQINEEQKEFLQKHWPGKITAVLWGNHILVDGIESQEGKIGLRIPNYPLVQTILKAFGNPLTGTSANTSGMPSCRDSREVLSQFEGQKLQPDMIIDAGKLPESSPSQVIDITQTPYQILRA